MFNEATFLEILLPSSGSVNDYVNDNFYRFRRGPHISFKNPRHNHLRCLMVGEVSLET